MNQHLSIANYNISLSLSHSLSRPMNTLKAFINIRLVIFFYPVNVLTVFGAILQLSCCFALGLSKEQFIWLIFFSCSVAFPSVRMFWQTFFFFADVFFSEVFPIPFLRATEWWRTKIFSKGFRFFLSIWYSFYEEQQFVCSFPYPPPPPPSLSAPEKSTYFLCSLCIAPFSLQVKLATQLGKYVLITVLSLLLLFLLLLIL